MFQNICIYYFVCIVLLILIYFINFSVGHIQNGLYFYKTFTNLSMFAMVMLLKDMWNVHYHDY